MMKLLFLYKCRSYTVAKRKFADTVHKQKIFNMNVYKNNADNNFQGYLFLYRGFYAITSLKAIMFTI